MRAASGERPGNSENASDDNLLQLDWRDIYHLILLPMYKEPYVVVKETFESLLAAHYPKDKFIVVLALEERGGDDARETGERIKREYGDKFFKFLLTTHPKDLSGEIPGKSSNQSWAAKEVKEKVIDPMVASSSPSQRESERGSSLDLEMRTPPNLPSARGGKNMLRYFYVNRRHNDTSRGGPRRTWRIGLQ